MCNGEGTKSFPLWNTRPPSEAKSVLPCTSASHHSVSSRDAVLNHLRRAELSMERVVMVFRVVRDNNSVCLVVSMM